MLTNHEEFLDQLVGLTATNVRRGAGTAILLDLVGTSVSRAWIMIEWSWRVEQGSRILLGSFNSDSELNAIIDLIESSEVSGASFSGEIPELSVTFSNGLRLASFTTITGDPEWSIHVSGTTLHFASGRYVYESTANQ